jgi:2-iminoacetate synthase
MPPAVELTDKLEWNEKPMVTNAIVPEAYCQLEALILRVGDHPEVRLKLLAEVSAALEDCSGLRAADRALLAEKVERWRYQLLNHNAEHLTDDQAELTQRLDLLGLQLGGRESRPPRSLRAALDDARNAPLPSGVAACLDPKTPLEDIENEARMVTDRHFGTVDAPSRRSMLLYAPLYLSNHCINYCLYCGFRYPNPMEREQLDLAQALDEAEVLVGRGFRHLLLVAGEYPRLISVAYLAPIVRALSQRGFAVAVEIAPQSTLDYAQLREAGTLGVTLYQETYDPERYSVYHPKGTKAWYDWRLEGPERALEAGIRRIGLGILLGLGDPLDEFQALLAHGRYLLDRFPDLKLSFSLPRIHDAPEGFTPPHRVDDETFIRLYCALRMAMPGANLVLSTREPAALRDRLARTCITQMSAGSSTAPGGYRQNLGEHGDRQQFPVFDQRSALEVSDHLARSGFRVVWDLSTWQTS